MLFPSPKASSLQHQVKEGLKLQVEQVKSGVASSSSPGTMGRGEGTSPTASLRATWYKCLEQLWRNKGCGDEQVVVLMSPRPGEGGPGMSVLALKGLLGPHQSTTKVSGNNQPCDGGSRVSSSNAAEQELGWGPSPCHIHSDGGNQLC